MTKVKRDLGVLTRDGYWKNVPDNVFDDDKVTSSGSTISNMEYLSQSAYEDLEDNTNDVYFVKGDTFSGIETIYGKENYIEGLFNLSNWKTKLDALKSGGTGKLNISFIGDSITEGANSGIPIGEDSTQWIDNGYVGQIRTEFKNRFEDVGKGVIHPKYPKDNPLWTLTGTWNKDVQFGIMQQCYRSNTALDTATIDFNGDGIRVYYVQGPVTGSFNWSVDGGSQTLINTVSGGLNNTYIDITGQGAGDHTLELEIVGDDSIYLIGAQELKGITGVIANACALWGAIAYNAGKDFEIVRNAEINALEADLVVISFLANDSNSNTVVATYKDQIQTVITQAKDYGADVLLTTVGIWNGLEDKQEAYVEAVRELAIENNCALYDNFKKWGTWERANSEGWLQDDVHASRSGHSIYKEDLYKLINR